MEIHAESQLSARKNVTVIVIHTGEESKFHFCRELTGPDNDLWFPLYVNKSLHEAVEAVLTGHGIAENVTRMEPVSRGAMFTDWNVIYNCKS